jgi:hypothetical protein
MDIGFTGTQDDLPLAQQQMLRHTFIMLHKLGIVTMHNGDCIGADFFVYNEWKHLRGKVVGHPPDIASKRAFCSFDAAYDPKSYLARNKDIVDCCDLLIAAPNSFKRKLRSGTWSTIRYAEKTKPVLIIYPDGSRESIVPS